MSTSLPLHALHAAAGAVFTERAGWQVPSHYGAEADEYRAALGGAALFDLSHHARIELRGPEARSFLHNLCTNAVKDLAVGAGGEAFLTTAKARVVALVWFSRPDDDCLWLDSAPGQSAMILAHLDHFLISEQVELIDRTDQVALLRLCGPEAARLLQTPLGATVRDLPPLGVRHADWPGVGTVHVRRHQLLALDGYDLFVPVAAAADLWKLLTAAGARPAGEQVYEVLRVEAGLPRFGSDIDEDRLAMEVGRPQAISYTKGCYLGQETIVMARDRGQVNRQLLGITAATGPILAAGTKLLRGDAEVGHVTSSVFSPRLGQVVALAYLRRGNGTVGTELLIEPSAAGRWATVASLPFCPSPALALP